MNEQQKFWHKEYSDEYLKNNDGFNKDLGIKAWKEMLKKTDEMDSVLECGCNIGRNIDFLNHVLPNTKKSIIELSPEPYKIVTSKNNFEYSSNSSILDAKLPLQNFDLVYTQGVLIHIHPEELINNLKKMYDFSKKYILIGEYFNRTPTSIEYRGRKDLLFKRDFGKLFIDNFDCKLVDYGFLWGYIFDDAGFDDITYWLFEKNNSI
jgi:pseudaminic acid biosynthesis-associated methylase